ncbi:MAG: hypothetical protein GX275_11145 [Clostridiales bacterium]|nr:hypothetical protein [Clostridiales bacterium]
MKSIKSKLVFIFSGLLVVIILALCIFGYGISNSKMKSLANSQIDSKVHTDLNSFENFIALRHGTILVKNNKLIDSKGVSIEGHYEVVDDVEKKMNDLATIFKLEGDNFVRVSTNIQEDSGKRLEGESLDINSEAYKALINGEEYTGNEFILDKEYKSSYKPLKDYGGNIIGAIGVSALYEDVIQEVNEGLDVMKTGFIALGTISVVIAIVIVLYVGNSITKGLVKTVKFTKNIQELDVSKEVPKDLIKSKDEVGQVAKALSIIVDNLKEFIVDTNNLSNGVNNHSKELLEKIEEVDTASGEIASVITEISTGATSQAKETEEGSEKALSLGKAIEKNRVLLDDILKSMAEVEVLRKDGLVSINQLSKESEENSNATNDIYQVIINTNTKAKEIEKASIMIKSIAEQTNLLALNAAIEAARAGESGKGFAVVADEVRKLAEESNKFTGQIQKVIAELTSRTESAVETMDKMNEIVESQSKCVDNTANKFNEILEKLDSSVESLGELKISSSVMEKEKEKLLLIMHNLSAIAEENAASTEEVAASAEEQSSIVSDFKDSINTLVELAVEMKKNIDKFNY